MEKLVLNRLTGHTLGSNTPQTLIQLKLNINLLIPLTVLIQSLLCEIMQ